MARTTAAAVKAVMLPGRDYDLTRNPDLTPFIDTASLMVDQVVTCAADRSETLSDARLEMIERWLAAHYYQQSDQGYTSRSTAGASGAFHGQTAMYLESTKYGQTALRLDTSGCLNALAGGAERKRVRAAWLGRAPSEQTDYEDRD